MSIAFWIIYALSLPFPLWLTVFKVKEILRDKTIKPGAFEKIRPANRWDLVSEASLWTFVSLYPLVNSAVTLVLLFNALWKKYKTSKLYSYMTKPL